MQVRVHEVYTVQSTSGTHSCRGVKCTYASLAPRPHPTGARGMGMCLVCMVVVSPICEVFTSPLLYLKLLIALQVVVWLKADSGRSNLTLVAAVYKCRAYWCDHHFTVCAILN